MTERGVGRISANYRLIALAIVIATAAILLWIGRPPICTCGEVKLWTGVVQRADNSQPIADWYTSSLMLISPIDAVKSRQAG